MRTRTRLTAFLAIFVVIVGVMSGVPAAPASAGTLQISGKVFLGGGTTPAGAAEVRVYYTTNFEQPLDGAQSVMTDAAGAYLIDGLDAGRYYFYFEYLGSEGFLSAWYREDASSTGPGSSITITETSMPHVWQNHNQLLAKVGAISGTVALGAAGAAPAAGEVSVSYRVRTSWSRWSELSAPIAVEAGGAFVIPNLPPGKYGLKFSYTGTEGFQPRAWKSTSGSTYWENSSYEQVTGESTKVVDFTYPELRTLSGTVYLGNSSSPAGAGDVSVTLEYWDWDSSDWNPVAGGSAATDAAGAFSIGGLVNYGYRVTYSYVGADVHIARTTTYGSGSGGAAGPGWDKTLKSGLAVAGTVYMGDSSRTAADGEVVVEFRQEGRLVQSVPTGSSGEYLVNALDPGTYSVIYKYDGDERFIDLNYTGQSPIRLTADLLEHDVAVPRANWITGTVVDANDNPIVGARVYASGTRDVAVNYNLAMSATTFTDASGNYVLKDLPDGKVKVEFSGGTSGVIYGNQGWPYSSPRLAEYIVYSGGELIEGIDGQLSEAGTIKVSVSAPELTPADFANVTSKLFVYDGPNETWVEMNQFFPKTSPPTVLNGLQADYYFVETVYSGEKGFASSQSDVIELLPGATHDVVANLHPVDIECVANPLLPTGCRIGGSNRFVVSATISEVGFEPGVPVVYIANGVNYPDALSAAPAATQQDGPLLLVQPGSIPSVIKAEIERLQPQRIVVVGGPGAVSDAVYNKLSTMAPAIERLGGSNRYATSRSIAQFAFGDVGATDAYIVTGRDFPDSLSASGAAASREAPIIAVNGEALSVDAATRDLLLELGVTTVHIVGGPGAVSNSLAASINAIPGVTVVRHSGSNRYATSSAVNGDAFESAATVFLAVGTTYPDALSGGALAGAFGSPLFVIPANCIPANIAQDIEDLGASSMVVLGGPAAVNDSVMKFTVCGR